MWYRRVSYYHGKNGGKNRRSGHRKKSIETCKKRLDEEKIIGDLKVGDATILQFSDESFDCVFSADFFEHISYEQKQAIISEAYRVLKPGGILTIKTPNLSYLRLSIILKRFTRLCRFKSPFIYIAHTKNNPDSVHHGLTTYKELERLLEENFFHTPIITYLPLIRKGVPGFLIKYLFGKKLFTEHIIITTRKALFQGMYR